MSAQQLRKLEAEKERIKEQLELSKNFIKVSEACEQLVEFIKKTEDPLLPGFDGEINPWIKSEGGNDV
ncbi:hypothetical protein QOT17_020525 [Balamuthia mandrillaris]